MLHVGLGYENGPEWEKGHFLHVRLLLIRIFRLPGYYISYLRVYPWALRLYHPEALLYSLKQNQRLSSIAEGLYNINAHG